jgi:hypothetical protein
MINDKINILILTLDHYESVKAEVDLLKGATLYCASHDLYLDLKKKSKNVIYIYNQEFYIDLKKRQKKVKNFLDESIKLDAFEKLAIRFSAIYEFSLSIAAQEITEFITDNIPNSNVFIPITNSKIKIFETFLGYESIIIYLINLNKNLYVFDVSTYRRLNSNDELQITSGYPYKKHKTLTTKIELQKVIINSAIDIEVKKLTNNENYLPLAGSYGVEEKNLTSISIPHYLKKRQYLSIKMIKSFNSTDDIIRNFIYEIATKDFETLVKLIKQNFGFTNQIKLIISQHAFPESAALLKCISFLEIESEINLIPHLISVLDLDLWNRVNLPLQIHSERKVVNSKDTKLKVIYNPKVSHLEKFDNEKEWNGSHDCHLDKILIVEPAIFELVYPILPMKYVENFLDEILLLPKKLQFIVKRRNIWGSNIFFDTLNKKVNFSFCNQSLIEEAQKCSITIFFSQSSVGIIESIRAGSIAILCLSEKQNDVIDIKFGEGLFRKVPDYALIVGISKLSEMIQGIESDEKFASDLYQMQYNKLKSDYGG